jgi:hypothetical protein
MSNSTHVHTQAMPEGQALVKHLAEGHGCPDLGTEPANQAVHQEDHRIATERGYTPSTVGSVTFAPPAGDPVVCSRCSCLVDSDEQALDRHAATHQAVFGAEGGTLVHDPATARDW